jgi:hypothetical protein
MEAYIKKMDISNLELCAEFFAKARGVNIDLPLVTSDYLKWKYLSKDAPDNLCLFLESNKEICAIVGGIVWRYVIKGKELQVCFPVDWYSSVKSPVKGAGRKVMKALMEQFSVSVAVGGTQVCFDPQISLGFKDIGDVFLLGLEQNKISNLRDFARKTRNFVVNPICYWRALNITKRFDSKNKVIFKKEELSDDWLLNFQGWHFLSQSISRSFLIRKWRHYMLQPYNRTQVVSVYLREKISYLLISEFNDARNGYVALADALCDSAHYKEDILAAFAAYAESKRFKGALFMTSNEDILSLASSLGYRIYDSFRTQYYSLPDAPACLDMRECPEVFFLSGDEMMYRRSGKQC